MQNDFQKPGVGWPEDQEEDALLLLAAKPREEGKMSVFQQSHDLGTLVPCCDPVGICSDPNIWEVTALTQERKCLIPKAGF